MADLKPITKYEVDDAGAEHQQFWQGRSAMNTRYNEVVVGQADTCGEAYEDAIDQLAELGYDVESMPKKPDALDLKAGLDKDMDEEFSYYVAIYVI